MRKILLKRLFLVNALFCGIVSSLGMEADFEMLTSQSAFIAKQDGQIIKAVGAYEVRRSPYSTFKIALALMGFDAGLLHDKDNPKWPFKKEYEKNFQSWYTPEKGKEYNWLQDHTPSTFMKNSVVWFSHQITQALGKEKFKNYIEALKYGNKDVSGTQGQDDGLLNSWLGTSLEISPLEQVELLEKMLAKQLPISAAAQKKTMEIMDREENWNGWKLYGKTGGGSDNTGWFVGWIEKGDKKIIFAQYLNLTDPGLDLMSVTKQKTVGLTAKELIKKKLFGLL